MRYSLFLLLLLSSCTYNEILPVCEPDEQEFSDLVQLIIEEKCMGCHNEAAGRPAILITYDGVIDAADKPLLMPGDNFGFDEEWEFLGDGKSYSPTRQTDI